MKLDGLINEINATDVLNLQIPAMEAGFVIQTEKGCIAFDGDDAVTIMNLVATIVTDKKFIPDRLEHKRSVERHREQTAEWCYSGQFLHLHDAPEHRGVWTYEGRIYTLPLFYQKPAFLQITFLPNNSIMSDIVLLDSSGNVLDQIHPYAKSNSLAFEEDNDE